MTNLKNETEIETQLSKLLQLSLHEFEKAVFKLPPHLFPQLIKQLQKQASPLAEQKLACFLQRVQDPHLLEQLGKNLSIEQLFSLLKSQTPAKTFSSLIMGLSPMLFEKLIALCPENEFFALKSMAKEEPIQHQLILFLHAFEAKLKKITEFAKDFEKNPSLTLDDLDQLSLQINPLDLLIQKALALVWNTERNDLITSFNHLKEQLFKISRDWIGEARTFEKTPSGLYRIAEERALSSTGLNLLQDKDPSIEALAELSLWTEEDYLKAGLISKEKGKNEKKTPQEMAQKTLNEMGIHTLADLKALRIFSKKQLLEFLHHKNTPKIC